MSSSHSRVKHHSSRNRYSRIPQSARLIRADMLAVRGVLSGLLLHEFNNRLQIIKGYTELALRQSVADRADRSLPMMCDSVERTIGFVAAVQKVSRWAPESENIYRIVDLVDPVVAPLEVFLAKKGIAVAREYGGSELLVRGNGLELRHVIASCILFLREAVVPEGDTLTVRIQPCRRTISVSFCVSGRNIPGGRLRALFRPGWFDGESPGTGLGLYVPHCIVRSHAGTLRVRSGKDTGTMIEMVLPQFSEAGSGRNER